MNHDATKGGAFRATLLLIATVIALAALAVSAAGAENLVDAYRSGWKLSAKDAAKIESKLESHPDNAAAHAELVGFYTLSPEAPAPEESVKGRRRQLLWLAQYKPDADVWGQWSYGFAVYLKGEKLADPDGFNAIRAVWLEQLAAHPGSEKIRINAALFFSLSDPEAAVRLMRDLPEKQFLGTEYARLLLGEVALDHAKGDPVFVDRAIADSPLAKQALEELQNSSDPKLMGQAGYSLALDGQKLWSRGVQDWDYSPLATSLLKRARELDPHEMKWFIANPSLPQPGERRPLGFRRLSEEEMQSRLLDWKPPVVPDALRGVHGTVVLQLAIDPSGKVVHAIPQSGPAALYDLSVQTAESWKYMSMDGTPLFVYTTASINYR